MVSHSSFELWDVIERLSFTFRQRFLDVLRALWQSNRLTSLSAVAGFALAFVLAIRFTRFSSRHRQAARPKRSSAAGSSSNAEGGSSSSGDAATGQASSAGTGPSPSSRAAAAGTSAAATANAGVSSTGIREDKATATAVGTSLTQATLRSSAAAGASGGGKAGSSGGSQWAVTSTGAVAAVVAGGGSRATGYDSIQSQQQQQQQTGAVTKAAAAQPSSQSRLALSVRKQLSGAQRVTVQLLGVALTQSTPDELKSGASLRPYAADIIAAIALAADVYLLVQVADDSSQEAVLAALAAASLIPAPPASASASTTARRGPINPCKVLFCEKPTGVTSFVRQLEPDWHFDSSASVVDQLKRFVRYLLHVAPNVTAGVSANVVSVPTLEAYFGTP